MKGMLVLVYQLCRDVRVMRCLMGWEATPNFQIVCFFCGSDWLGRVGCPPSLVWERCGQPALNYSVSME